MKKCLKMWLGIGGAAVFALSQICFAFPTAAVSASADAAKTIKLEAYGGSLTSDTVALTSDTVLPTLPVPEKEGYDFIGWYTKEVETEYWGDENGDNWTKYKNYYNNGNYTYIDGKSIDWYNAGETNPDTNPENATNYDWQNSRWIETSVGLASATKGQPAGSGKALPEQTETLYAMYDPKNITVYWYSNGWKGIDDCWAVSTGRSTGFEYGGKFVSLPLDDWAPWAGHEFKGWVDKDGNKIEFTKVTYEREDVYSYILSKPYTPEKYDPILRLYAIYDGVTCCGGYVEPATVESIGGSGGYFDPKQETYTFSALFDSRYKDLSAAKWEILNGADELFDLTVSKDKTSATLSAKAGKQDEIAEGGNYRIDIRLTTGDKSVEAYATAAHDWDDGKILSGLANPCEDFMDVQYTCRKCGQTRTHTYDPDGHRYTYYRTEATCTEDAVEERYCVVCGKKESEVLQGTAKGHSYKTTTVKGCGGTVVTSTCTTCGHVETEEDHTACHDWNSTYTVDKAATCTTEGSESIRCKNCNIVKESRVIPAKGHSYKENKVAATCEKEGYTTHTCTACGDSYTDAYVEATGHNYKETVKRGCNGNEVTIKTCTACGETETIGNENALGHVWGEFHIDKAATCTKAGSKSITCTVCGEVKETKEIPATGHTYTEDVHKATCTENGYTVKTCMVCGESVTEDIVTAAGHNWDIKTESGCGGATVVTKTCKTCGAVEKTGDPSSLDHVWGQYHVDREATCTTAGSKSITCVKCGAVKETKEIPATGHTYTEDVHAATCTEDGYIVKTCTKCHTKETVAGEPAKNHSYVRTETEATCTENGVVTYRCSVCGSSYTAEGKKATGHSYKTTETEATCTENGTISYECTVCGDSYTEQGAEATGHSYEKTETEATCTENGTITYECTVCGDSYTEEGAEATGHSYERTETEATCTENGTITYECTACGDSYTEEGEAAKGHSFTEQVETGCNGATFTTRTCEACGTVETEGDRAALEHDWSVEETEATCAKEGTRSVVCTKCGEVKESETFAKTEDHEWSLYETVAPTEVQAGKKVRKCTVCGKTVEEAIPALTPAKSETESAAPEAAAPVAPETVPETAPEKAPEEAPEAAAPEAAAPEVSAPKAEAPKAEAPETKAPEASANGTTISEAGNTAVTGGSAVMPLAAVIALCTVLGAAVICVPTAIVCVKVFRKK